MQRLYIHREVEGGIDLVLYVIRHGETDFNVQGRYAGSTDVPLNDNGFIQAKELAVKLRDIQFDIIISSPLLRARQTAEVVQKYFQKPLLIIDQFAERNVGVYEGLTREEAKSQYPDLWSRECTRQPDDAPTGGETIRQFDMRITSALKQLNEKYPNDKILLVCHAFVSRLINKHYKKLTYDNMHNFTLSNCEIVSYTV
jgi:probable phosphoglycerate mutase